MHCTYAESDFTTDCCQLERDMSITTASTALNNCRLNWQLHFGEAPKWSTTVKFILADVAPGQRDVGRAALSLTGDAGAIAAQLTEALPATHGFDANRYQAWRQQLADKAGSSVFCSVCCKSSTQVTLCVTASQ